MAHNTKIPTAAYPQMQVMHEAGQSLRHITAWLLGEYQVRVSAEAVRKVLVRMPSKPDLNLDPGAQLERIARLCWGELLAAQRLAASRPSEWKRLHSALTLSMRIAQAQLKPTRGDDGAGQQAAPSFSLPAIGLGAPPTPPAIKPEA